MQIDIEGRHTEIRESWRALIERKLAKLERYPNEITHARITITHNPHHHLGDNQVQIVLSAAGQTFTVKKSGAQIPVVLRTALAAAERELDAYHSYRQTKKSRSRSIREPLPPLTGTVVRVLRAEGGGYISVNANQHVYFHRRVLEGFSFDDLTPGMLVAVELGEGKAPLQATRVFPPNRR
ncbi:MAG: HPF/RaiA family ribosome-associated protein [Candidatus Binatia bacterium]|nr:HPF/RaiA family ribosome-associated protein [Candidatus Binatia bacterium]